MYVFHVTRSTVKPKVNFHTVDNKVLYSYLLVIVYKRRLLAFLQFPLCCSHLRPFLPSEVKVRRIQSLYLHKWPFNLVNSICAKEFDIYGASVDQDEPFHSHMFYTSSNYVCPRPHTIGHKNIWPLSESAYNTAELCVHTAACYWCSLTVVYQRLWWGGRAVSSGPGRSCFLTFVLVSHEQSHTGELKYKLLPNLEWLTGKGLPGLQGSPQWMWEHWGFCCVY